MDRLFLGTQGWSYSAWVGPFYPPGTSSSRYLEEYSKHFSTVEMDTTFYATPRLSTVSGWRDRSPEGFVFAAKFPQAITHEGPLTEVGEQAANFLQTMSELGPKLGPLLMQMPPSFTADEFPALETFLCALPTGIRYALEVRHRSWLGEDTRAKLLRLLEQQGVALCLVQHSYMPKLDQVTAPFVYVRWLGRREDIPDDDYSKIRIDRERQLDTWSEQIRNYLDRGLIVYGYFNNHYQGHSPASVRSLQARLFGDDADPASNQS